MQVGCLQSSEQFLSIHLVRSDNPQHLTSECKIMFCATNATVGIKTMMLVGLENIYGSLLAMWVQTWRSLETRLCPTWTEILCSFAKSVSGIFYALSGILKYLQFTSNCSQLLDLQLGASTRDVGLMDHAWKYEPRKQTDCDKVAAALIFSPPIWGGSKAQPVTLRLEHGNAILQQPVQKCMKLVEHWETFLQTATPRGKIYGTFGTLRNVPSHNHLVEKSMVLVEHYFFSTPRMWA